MTVLRFAAGKAYLTKNQLSRQAMIKSVLGVLEDSVSITASVPSIARCYAGLNSTADAIDEAAVTQQSRNGLVAAKATAKGQLLDVAHDAASAVGSYGTESENDELSGRCDYSRSDLGNGRDSEVVSRCKSVHAAATGVSEELADHGVTDAKLTTLKKKIDAFDKISTKPRQSVAASSAATKRLPILLRQANRCLTKQLDKVMVRFKTTQPEFYAKYRASRAVVTPGARPNKDGNIVAAPNTAPGAKAA
jgi:hypothetical protein